MKNHCEIIEKVFKTEIDRSEMKEYKAYSQAIKGIIRCSWELYQENNIDFFTCMGEKVLTFLPIWVK